MVLQYVRRYSRVEDMKDGETLSKKLEGLRGEIRSKIGPEQTFSAPSYYVPSEEMRKRFTI